MGERVNGIHEVRGSIPLASTRPARGFGRSRLRNGPGRVPGRGGPERLGRRWGRLRGGGPMARLLVRFAGIAQLVEHNLAKVGVAGSSPVSRFSAQHRLAVSCSP